MVKRSKASKSAISGMARVQKFVDLGNSIGESLDKAKVPYSTYYGWKTRGWVTTPTTPTIPTPASRLPTVIHSKKKKNYQVMEVKEAFQLPKDIILLEVALRINPEALKILVNLIGSHV